MKSVKTPGEFANLYAKLQTWYWDGTDWLAKQAPVVNYLQNNGSAQVLRAAAAEQSLRRQLSLRSEIKNVNLLKTFNYAEYDYINNSIRRCFIGKASPWEIQETLQLASEFGAINDLDLYCRECLGVDCGGFVANYWGVSCPHMTDVAPVGWDGIFPRNFWANARMWPDVMSRRRQNASDVRPGDAAIFFKDVKDNNPDLAKQRDSSQKFIEGSGSEAFHIGLVNEVGFSGEKFTSLQIAESSGASTIYGGSGVNVRAASVNETGKSGKWVYCQPSGNERIYFVAPPSGWGPESAYSIGEES